MSDDKESGFENLADMIIEHMIEAELRSMVKASVKALDHVRPMGVCSAALRADLGDVAHGAGYLGFDFKSKGVGSILGQADATTQAKYSDPLLSALRTPKGGMVIAVDVGPLTQEHCDEAVKSKLDLLFLAFTSEVKSKEWLLASRLLADKLQTRGVNVVGATVTPKAKATLRA